MLLHLRLLLDTRSHAEEGALIYCSAATAGMRPLSFPHSETRDVFFFFI